MDQETKNKALITAAQQENQTALISLIAGEAQLYSKDEQGNTALHWAVKKKNSEIINILIEKNDSLVIEFDKNGHSPLAVACQMGALEIVSILLDKQTTAQKLKNDKNALVLAIKGNWIDIVKILLEKNIGVEVIVDNQSPLIWAIEKGSIEIVKILLKHSKVDHSSKQKDATPLIQAIAKENLEIFDILLNIEGIDVNVRSEKESLSPLDLAIATKQGTFINRLLEHPKIVIDNYTPLLFLATTKNYKNIITLLIDKHNKDDITQFNDSFLIHWAAKKGYTDIVDKLLVKNYNVNQEDENGYSALHWAANNGHLETVESLLTIETIEINKKNKNGDTPLALAFIKNNKDIIKKLMKKDADTPIEIQGLPFKDWIGHQNNNFDDDIKQIVNEALEKKELEALQKKSKELEETWATLEKEKEEKSKKLKEKEIQRQKNEELEKKIEGSNQQEKEENEQQPEIANQLLHKMNAHSKNNPPETDGRPSRNGFPVDSSPTSQGSFASIVESPLPKSVDKNNSGPEI